MFSLLGIHVRASSNTIVGFLMGDLLMVSTSWRFGIIGFDRFLFLFLAGATLFVM
jgi:hypothetical protein